ncbi:hypothetical protein KPL74_06820 [Bacillus sp. NP157]|nr:hypothetical protein KPL74_06820 [Bacillus sp. NP157]
MNEATSNSPMSNADSTVEPARQDQPNEHTKMPPLSEIKVVKGLIPIIPDAFSDLVVPNTLMTEGLLVHAPIITDQDGQNYTDPGFDFDLYYGEQRIPNGHAVYSDTTHKYVPIIIPAEFIDGLDEGVVHSIRYMVSARPFGDMVFSEDAHFRIDRTPAGGRLLSRIMFPQRFHAEGVCLDTLFSLPGGALEGVIADYRDLDPLDIVSVRMRLQGQANEIPVCEFAAGEDRTPMTIHLTRSDFEKLGEDGPVDIYYRVRDKAGNLSEESVTATLEQSFVDTIDEPEMSTITVFVAVIISGDCANVVL